MKSLRMIVLLLAVPLLPTHGAPRERDGRELRARLTGFQETPLTLVSSARGQFLATISEDETSIDFQLSYQGFDTDVGAAHIHLGRPATSGGVTIFLCGGGGRPACPVRTGIVQGTIRAANVIAIPAQDLAAGDLASVIMAIRAGATYANVHSVKHPGGEIRGQILTGRSPGGC
jgi:hypothetical protein